MKDGQDVLESGEDSGVYEIVVDNTGSLVLTDVTSTWILSMTAVSKPRDTRSAVATGGDAFRACVKTLDELKTAKSAASSDVTSMPIATPESATCKARRLPCTDVISTADKSNFAADADRALSRSRLMEQASHDGSTL
jgi:hypothetical protein